MMIIFSQHQTYMISPTTYTWYSARPTDLSSFPTDASIHQNSSVIQYNLLLIHSHQDIAKISHSSKVTAGAHFPTSILHHSQQYYKCNNLFLARRGVRSIRTCFPLSNCASSQRLACKYILIRLNHFCGPGARGELSSFNGRSRDRVNRLQFICTSLDAVNGYRLDEIA
jgi:hypothetical protein